MEDCKKCPHPRRDHYVFKGSAEITGCSFCPCVEFVPESQPEPESAATVDDIEDAEPEED